MEEQVWELQAAGIAVSLLVSTPSDPEVHVGVRLHTFGKQLPPRRMVISEGATFSEALDDAIAKAENGRWENLDYAARPWAVAIRSPRAARFGL